MERQLQGVHTAATKERFLICVDVSVPRHAALPQHMLRADPNLLEWTWLPLTPSQAGVFGWEDMLDNPAYFLNPETMRVDDDTAENAAVGEQGLTFEGPATGFPARLPDGVDSRIRYVKVQQGDLAAWKLCDLAHV